MFNHIQRHEELVKSQIAGLYSDQIEKGGEGSKGGKVIGHTKSGKPIYDTASHSAHKDFTIADHNDAIDAHDKVRQKYHNNPKSTDKDKEANDNAHEQQKHHIGVKNGLWNKEREEKDTKKEAKLKESNEAYYARKDRLSNAGHDSARRNTKIAKSETDLNTIKLHQSQINSQIAEMFSKAKRKVPIGTISNDYKKIKEGVWKKVSKHGMTKDEHNNELVAAKKRGDRPHADKEHSKNWDKHIEARNSLDDKDYTDTDVSGGASKKAPHESLSDDAKSLVFHHGYRDDNSVIEDARDSESGYEKEDVDQAEEFLSNHTVHTHIDPDEEEDMHEDNNMKKRTAYTNRKLKAGHQVFEYDSGDSWHGAISYKPKKKQ
jgi:hypothetical protein